MYIYLHVYIYLYLYPMMHRSCASGGRSPTRAIIFAAPFEAPASTCAASISQAALPGGSTVTGLLCGRARGEVFHKVRAGQGASGHRGALYFL